MEDWEATPSSINARESITDGGSDKFMNEQGECRDASLQIDESEEMRAAVEKMSINVLYDLLRIEAGRAIVTCEHPWRIEPPKSPYEYGKKN